MINRSTQPKRWIRIKLITHLAIRSFYNGVFTLIFSGGRIIAFSKIPPVSLFKIYTNEKSTNPQNSRNKQIDDPNIK
jgi:hypothetical protein